MDFMKVFDQTVREIKREVNLKVLKVPEIEQKVLDATDDEPWGPHGSSLSEIARATKKFTECQMIMNVLWTRLTEGSARWRHAYKALTVIEYLLANGSERAVDDILEHSSRISSLSRFEYVEPNGKDAGINVRKKVETIMNLVNDTDKIKAVREKANANRDKYVGLSSSGITNKSSSASYGGSTGGRYGGYGSDDQYGSLGSSRDVDSFRGEGFSEGLTGDNGFSKSKKGTSSRNKSSASKPSSNKGLDAAKSSSAPINDDLGDDDFDDFDPRGSAKSGVDATANTTKAEVDLFGPNLMDDFMGAPSVATTDSATEKPDEVDLFADADFVSAPPLPESKSSSKTEIDVDLFSGEPNFTPAFSSTTTDFFSAPEPSLTSDTKAQASMPNPISSETFDPFASIPLNNFSTDPFGDFTSNVSTTTPVKGTQDKISDPSTDDTFGTFTTASTSTNISQNSGNSSAKPSNAKGGFQVKSGIWADSLSRGIIDLNITAPKKVNLADIGIVGGLDDASNEKDKFSSFGPASYLGSSPMGLSSGGSTGGSKLSGFGQQQYGGFK